MSIAEAMTMESTESKGGEKMSDEQIKVSGKLNNLFTNASKVINKDNFVSVVKTVGAGIGHIMEMAAIAGISVAAVIMEYVVKFVYWLRLKFDAAKARTAQFMLSYK